MSSNPMTNPEDSKQNEAMQQNPSAPPMGPPPTYTEAINSPPYPAMLVPTSSQSPPYPTNSAPYPTANSTMPLPSAPTVTAPYPVDDNIMPQAMAPVQQPIPPVVHDTQSHNPPLGFNNPMPPPGYQQPIVNQPGAYNDQHEYIHPKTTYVVLQDDRRNRRRDDDDDCSCTDWLMCCWCCVESFRCLVLCLECAAACK